MTSNKINVIGAGLAGCEVAWQLSQKGYFVDLYEMRPKKMTDAHKTNKFAELVCSNSFRSDDNEKNAVGQLKWELRKANSFILENADLHSVPAGGALAIDREKFSSDITEKISSNPLINIINEEILDVSKFKEPTVISTGPLTSNPLSDQIISITKSDKLAFFDAIAPIVYLESVNMNKAWFQSRYDKGNEESDKKAYLNCPLDEIQYKEFIDDIIKASKIDFKDWEKNTPYFQSCLPIEIMAESGIETLRFGPMKPVGLKNPHDNNNRPYAVVQLRPDNKEKTLYNMVGFQTKMKYGSQIDVFRKIPGLENVQFARLGGIHRNTFINTPKLLSNELSLKNQPNIYFAGQITGVEGYVESTAIGLLVAFFIDQKISKKPNIPPPPTTAIGSLYHHLLFKNEFVDFQPMNVNFGLFKELPKNKVRKLKKEIKKVALTTKAKEDWCKWMSSIN
ncbi:MAG: methylenetetrahydrofolate--tRNA-(uracil(54)-C(5))-methyltransferase (FADH(2)-oxidizing) TrmFO [Paracoccaceae bacterium]